MPVVNDIDRPDVNGVEPKMKAICEQASKLLRGLTSVMVISTDDNLMSSVHIRGSLDAQETWPYGIFQNSRYFQFHITPEKGKRYYDANDKAVTVELIGSKYNLSKFRKYSGPVNKCLERIAAWLISNVNPTGQIQL